MEDKPFRIAIIAITVTKIVSIVILVYLALAPSKATTTEPQSAERPRLPQAATLVNIPAYIRFQAGLHGVDPDTAVRIASCESDLDPFAINETSGAVGLYQFLPSTLRWIEYEGDPTSVYDSVDAFMEWYPKYPGWWYASEKCWGYEQM